MILEIKSVASVIDTETKIVYPKYQMGGYDKLSGVHINDLTKKFVDEISEDDIVLINENLKSNSSNIPSSSYTFCVSSSLG